MRTPSCGKGSRTAVLLITVEEYFQARAFRNLVTPGEWDALPSRVRLSVDRLVEVLERHGVRATFFFDPWPAERRPEVVERVAEAGHEVATLGNCGFRPEASTLKATMTRLRRSRRLLEERSGRRVRGHRCRLPALEERGASFPDTLLEEGYVYSASGVDAWPWRRDGSDAASGPRLVERDEGTLLEITTTTLKLLGRPLLPACGTVLRHFPERTTTAGLRRCAEKGGRPVFHIHAWEVDPHQPDLPVSPVNRIRHYRGLDRAGERLDALLSELPFDSVAGSFGMDAASSRGRTAGWEQAGRPAPRVRGSRPRGTTNPVTTRRRRRP